VQSANPTQPANDDERVREDLRRKYDWLLRVRREAAAGTTMTRAEAQALAAAFPGALRELDDTPMEALELREAELKAGLPLPPWARPTWLYHAILRDLLADARSGARPQGGLVEVAIARVAAALGASEAEVTAHALPFARRRTTRRNA
jgi:hypothetical protein